MTGRALDYAVRPCVPVRPRCVPDAPNVSNAKCVPASPPLRGRGRTWHRPLAMGRDPLGVRCVHDLGEVPR